MENKTTWDAAIATLRLLPPSEVLKVLVFIAELNAEAEKNETAKAEQKDTA